MFKQARKPGSADQTEAQNARKGTAHRADSARPAAWTRALDRLPLQAKLTVNQPGDPYEQEADQVAEQVMHMPAPQLQRKCACGGEAGPDGECAACRAKRLGLQRKSDSVAGMQAPASVHETIRAPGQPLDASTRGFMESRFGHDFGGVRVHTGAKAAESAKAVSAHAYTVGQNVVFADGRYAPGTAEGRKLIAHELTHTLQQQSSTVPRMIQRSQTANNVRFIRPPTLVPINPLDRQRLNEPVGYTTLLINGQRIDGPSHAANLALIETQMRPPDVVHAPGLVAGQVSCQFGPQFGIESSTEVIEATPPTASGWHALFQPAELPVPNPPACAGKVDIPVTERGTPSDLAYQQRVHNSEMEHVDAIEVLHNRHFVTYYNFAKTLSATAGTQADCEVSLRQRINQRDIQAATAFLLADEAETRRFDDPLSTHHSTLQQNIVGSCISVVLTESQTNPQQPGAGPGNVQPVAPQVQAVNAGNLSVKGSALMDGATLIRSFNSPGDATTALVMMASYGITEIHRIGPFEMLLNNGQPPSGAIAGIAGLDIDPDAFQVTIDITNPDDWVISQTVGTMFIPIVNFGRQRDEAYAAVELMRRHRFVRWSWFGLHTSPQMMYFTV